MSSTPWIALPEILRHKDLKMTKRYARVVPTHRLAAIGLLEQAYNQQTSAENGSNPAANPPALLNWQQKRQQTPQTPLLAAG